MAYSQWTNQMTNVHIQQQQKIVQVESLIPDERQHKLCDIAVELGLVHEIVFKS